MIDVFVVGSLNTDFSVEVAHRPLPGQTAIGGDLHVSAGGKGANQAAAIAGLGGAVALLGRVGDDDRGEILRRTALDTGVDTTFIRATPAVATGSAFVTVTPDGENTIVVSPGANAYVTPADIADAAAHIGRSGLLLVQLEIPMETVAAAVACATVAGVRVVLNAAPAFALAQDILACVDPLVVNETEARVLLGIDVSAANATAAAEALIERGAGSAVITLGSAGAVCVDSEGLQEHIRAPLVHVVDTTGAGDAFTGALALALARGASLAQAVQRGVHAGSLAVQQRGAALARAASRGDR